MKNQKHSRIGSFFRRIFNIRSWADAERLKQFWQFFVNGAKHMFVPSSTPKKASSAEFDAAVHQMNISEELLQQRKAALKRLSIIMVCITLGLIVYSCYHLIWGSWPAFFLSVAVTCIGAALAFRYHFWYFQISKRKLGCTFSEWFQQGLMGRK